jgi:hypothetical protein
MLETINATEVDVGDDQFVRNRLYHIKTEEQLIVHFKAHIEYRVQEELYACSGIYADTKKRLWQKVYKAWRQDKKDYVIGQLKDMNRAKEEERYEDDIPF